LKKAGEPPVLPATTIQRGTLMIAIIANIAGLIGVIFMLGAYLLVQSEKLLPGNIKFPLMNLIGASLVLVSLLFAWNLPSFIIELFWTLISIYGIWRIRRNKRSA
jgi:hypothetical protein